MPNNKETPEIVRIPAEQGGIQFPVPMKGGFGVINVDLEPGQQKTVVFPSGKRITVIRDRVH